MTTAMTVGTIDKAVVGNNPFNAATLADWIEFCDVKVPTQKTYNKAVENFFGYLNNNGVDKPSRETVIGYRDWLLAEGYKVSSARLYVTICKKFFRWLASKMIYPNVADGVKLPEKPDVDEHAHDALTVQEAQATLSSFEGKTDEKSIRDKCIMSLMIGAGLRSVEVVRMNIGDWECRRNQWFLKLQGKGKSSKSQTIPISAELKKCIDDYLSVRPAGKKGSALFISTAARNFGQRLQTQSISRLAKKTFAKIGIVSDRITCHSCRATFATLALDAGVSIRKVQKILRHVSTDTTEIYANDITRFNNEGVQIVSNLIFSRE